jgi:hypothetical protein
VKNLKDVKAKLLANPAVRQAYDAQAPEFELARELIAARTQAGLTQGVVAARMGTNQSVVARRVGADLFKNRLNSARDLVIFINLLLLGSYEFSSLLALAASW